MTDLTEFYANDPRPGVIIVVDWENIRKGAERYRTAVRPSALADALFRVQRIFGPYAGGMAFGDWGSRPNDGQEFSKKGIQPFNVPRTLAGKDRSDSAITIEVYDWIRDQKSLGVVLMATGDSDFEFLAEKCRDKDMRVVLCSFSQMVSRDMLSVVAVFPLEAELDNFRVPEHGLVQIEEAEADGNYDEPLRVFVHNVRRIDGRLDFVGYGKLCNEWMIHWGVARTETECFDLVEKWSMLNYIEKYEVENPFNPVRPTAAVRLNIDHPVVRDILGFGQRGPRNTVLPDQGRFDPEADRL